MPLTRSALSRINRRCIGPNKVSRSYEGVGCDQVNHSQLRLKIQWNLIRLHIFANELLNSQNITSQTSSFSNCHLVLALTEVKGLSRYPTLDFIRDVSWWYGVPWFPKLVSTTWKKSADIHQVSPHGSGMHPYRWLWSISLKWTLNMKKNDWIYWRCTIKSRPKSHIIAFN